MCSLRGCFLAASWWGLMLLTILLLLASLVQAQPSDSELIADIMTWIRANGGWISDKLEVRQIVGPLSGVFTKEALAEGEVVAEIPWPLIISPSSSLEDAEWFCEKAEELKERLSKDPSELNPYERYLSSRSTSHVPFYWSRKSKSLLRQLYKGFEIRYFDKEIEDLCEDVKPDDNKFLQALMLLQTRAEGENEDTLVPFQELMNHQNGHFTNADPRIEPGKGSRIVITRPVEAGEELQNTYNQCEWCDPSYVATPQIFELFGFVEPFPQRWVIADYDIIFDIFQHAEGQIEISFESLPDDFGVIFMQRRLQELEEFKQKYQDRTDLPKAEYDGIFQFHEAVVNAFSWAVQMLPPEGAVVDGDDDDEEDEEDDDDDGSDEL